jgi:3-hydroxyisobutyrate dehydrogenase
MDIAVLGTGTMGAPMARRLAAAGHGVRVWNRTPERARALTGGEGAPRVADDLRDAVRHADIVMTMLADGPAVQEVMGGGHGGLTAMDRGQVWWQASTVAVEETERFAAAADGAGLDYVDAPVLGTKGPAEEGRLTVLAAGADHALARCIPAFEAVGHRTVRLGRAPAATRTKLVMNGWVFGLLEALAETLAAAPALRVDPATVLEILDGSPMNAPYAQIKGKLMLSGATADASFSVRLAHKDARLLLDAARRAGRELAVVEAAERAFGRAEELGLADHDMAAIIRGAAERP